MTRDQMLFAFSEAQNYADVDAFASDIALSSAFLPGDDLDAMPGEADIEALRHVWITANAPFRAFADEIGFGQSSLSRHFAIPLRTVQGWTLGERACPPYIRLMIAELAGYIQSAL